MSATDSPSADAQEYFHAIEETFIRLRGAPLLLSPEDWRTARAWHEAGIPLELVARTLEEVFRRVRERDPERRVQSLRYCAPAVEEAWREVVDLGATGGRLEPVPLDVPARLRDLAAGLPDDLPRGAELAAALGELEGDAEAVESELESLEEDFLKDAVARLPAAERRRLEERVDRAVRRTSHRMASDEVGDLGRRLLRQYAREQLGLPALSLFVEPPSEPPSEPASG
mgnify:CR=1 FL=1